MVFIGTENAAVSNGATVVPLSTHPMSPPLLADDGSPELAAAIFAKSPPARSSLTSVSALAFAVASSAAGAFCGTRIRMWRMCACSGCLKSSFDAS
jgi:hypothetical protein